MIYNFLLFKLVQHFVLARLRKGRRIVVDNPLQKYLWLNYLRMRPHSLKLHLSNVCNLRCSYCYEDKSVPVEMDISTAFAVIRDVSWLSRVRLDIMGGEPLMRDGIYDIISFARSKKHIFCIQLYTNAILVDYSIAQRLSKCGVDNAIVSLSSTIPQKHDQTVKYTGAWQKTIRGIQYLNEAGISTYIIVVVTSHNVDELERFESLAKKMKVRTIYMPYIQQVEGDDFCIKDQKLYQQTISWIFNKSKKYKKTIINSARRLKGVCHAFPASITVTADGEVKPCPFTKLSLGNVFNTNIQEILIHSCENKDFLSFSALPQHCNGCSIADLCGGGCRTINYNLLFNVYKNICYGCGGPYSLAVDENDLGKYFPFLE